MNAPMYIWIRRATFEEWEEHNPIIRKNELIAIYNNDCVCYKIGDGQTNYQNLPWVTNLKDIKEFWLYIEQGLACKIVLDPYLIEKYKEENTK